MGNKYLVIAKYKSKYGLILYCAKGEDQNINFDNVFINTLYFKGSGEIETGKLYDFQTVKGENGLTYCFIV